MPSRKTILNAIRFVTSLAISTWGLVMILLGLAGGFPLWSAIGLVVTIVGLPLLGSHPWADSWLYPPSGNIEGGKPPPAVPAG